MCTCQDEWLNEQRPQGFKDLSFEDLLTDPMTRLVMESDGVSVREFTHILEAAREAIARRLPEAMPVLA